MFEPLSALTVLGFAIGTLGLIVSTISKVDEKIQEIRECESRLRSYNWQLRDACMELKVWQLTWIGKKAFPIETYVHFWGIEGMKDIQARVDGITELSSEINALLRRPVSSETGQSLPRPELQDWHRLIDQDLARLPPWRHTEHQKASLVRRIGFTLFHNAVLQEKLNRLRSHIEGLRDFTQYTFRLEQQGDPSKKVTSAELHRVSDMKTFIDRISNVGSLLYNSRLPYSRFEWAIEVGPPEAGQTQDLWSEVDTMHIDFIVRDTALHVQTKASRVRLCVEEQLAQMDGYMPRMIQRVDEVVLSRGRREHYSEYDRFFSLLEKPSRRSRPLRKMLTESIFSGSHRKSFEVERADLVYGLGHWMVLLWNTPWSCGLCTCGIRYIHLVDTRTRHSFLPCPSRSHWYPRCHPPTLAEDRFKLLGVVLAEIALALPISVVVDQEDTSYIIGEEIVGRKRLLGMLREKFGRNTITKAVSYCLDPDGHLLRPDHLEQYSQNIVLP